MVKNLFCYGLTFTSPYMNPALVLRAFGVKSHLKTFYLAFNLFSGWSDLTTFNLIRMLDLVYFIVLPISLLSASLEALILSKLVGK